MTIDQQFQNALNTGNTKEAIRLGQIIMDESLKIKITPKQINTISADNATKFSARSKYVEKMLLIRGERMTENY